MEFNRFYRIIRDKYITYAAAVEDFELLEELYSISHEQANYLFNYQKNKRRIKKIYDFIMLPNVNEKKIFIKALHFWEVYYFS